MNESSRTTYAVWSLRLGLAAMFGYSGIDILLHPTAWYWAVRGLPSFVQNIINAIGIDTYLMLQCSFEMLLAVIFLVPFGVQGTKKLFIAICALVMGVFLIFLTGRDFYYFPVNPYTATAVLVYMVLLLFSNLLRRFPLVRISALFAAVEMVAILLMVGVDTVTFRDFGPLGAAIALFFLL